MNNYPEHDRLNDLNELVNRMSEKQQLRFKQAIVRQTIYYVSKQLPPEEHDEGERNFILCANQWLEQPTEKNAEKAKIAAIADCIDGGVRYFDYSEYFHEPAWAAGSDAHEAAQHALTAAKTDLQYATQWQIKAALAILNNEDPPVLK